MDLDAPIPTHFLTDAERERLADAARSLVAAHPWIRVVYLYGSAARGVPNARDIDVGIVADPVPATWSADIALAGALADATGIHGVPFDVRIVNDGSPVFLYRMLKDSVLLAQASDAERVRFEVRAMSLWLDFRPVWERMRAAVLGGWARE